MHLGSMIKPGMRAVFYGRHSTDKQTMETQKSMALDFIKKNKCDYVGEYLDAAVSARKSNLDDRPGISQLLADAHLKKFDFVVISQHDRLARNPLEHQMIRITLKGCKIPVIVASSETLYDSGDLLVDLIKDGNSKFEVDNTRIRTRDTMNTLFRKGKWRGGKPPYGYFYDKETGLISVKEKELLLVRDIFRMYENFDGFDTIAAQLPLGSFEGCDWTDQAVRAVITNPFYAGYLSRGRKRYKANNSFNDRTQWEMVKSNLIEPAISMEKWERCWDIYQKRICGDMPPNRYKTSFMLAEILECSDCGQMLKGKDQTTTSKTGAKYGKKLYVCRTCGYKVDADKAHKLVEYLLRDLRDRHEEVIVENVLNSIKEDHLIIQHEIEVLEQFERSIQTKLGNFESELKQLFNEFYDLNVTDDKKSSIKSMIYVLEMSREKLKVECKGINDQITIKRNHLEKFIQLEVSREKVMYKINLIQSEKIKSKLLRGLLLEFVQRIQINGKGHVSIFARHAFLETTL